MVDAKNSADALIYSTEKSLAEMGAKVDGNLRMEIDDAVRQLKETLKGDDVERIRKLTEVLTRASHKLAESVYQQQGGTRAGADGGGSRARSTGAPDDDVVDADFQEVA